jgi:S-adenosylmethionine:diacylglycerol 3-amino-3-carboxypropyl transferase
LKISYKISLQFHEDESAIQTTNSSFLRDVHELFTLFSHFPLENTFFYLQSLIPRKLSKAPTQKKPQKYKKWNNSISIRVMKHCDVNRAIHTFPPKIEIRDC